VTSHTIEPETLFACPNLAGTVIVTPGMKRKCLSVISPFRPAWTHQTRRRDTRQMPSVRSRFQCASLAACMLLGASSSEAQSPVRQVLVLQSLDRGNLILDRFTGN